MLEVLQQLLLDILDPIVSGTFRLSLVIMLFYIFFSGNSVVLLLDLCLSLFRYELIKAC